MHKKQLSETDFEKIIDQARLAPSVHNTQPWKAKLGKNDITLFIDRQHALDSGDPTGRQTILSFGIFAEAVSLVAAEIGFKTKSLKLDHDQATIQLDTYKASKAHQDAKYLKTRSSDRSIYSPIDITKPTRQTITDSARDIEAKILFTDDPEVIKEVADHTSKGIALAMSNPTFRKELAEYLVLPGSKRQRGINVRSLYIPTPLAILQPLFVRLGLNTQAEKKLEKKRWLSASAIIFITTKGDMPLYWFEAGRAYLRASLAIEKLGLSQATSAATVEASNYHEDIESLLSTKERLQAVIRIGQGSKNRYYSPRVSTEELLH